MANSNGDARAATLEKTLDSLNKRFGEGAIMRLGDASTFKSNPSPPVPSRWTSPSASAACRAAGSSKSTAQNPPARPPSASTSSPKHKSAAASAPS
jgi:hypothetical protein